MRRPHHLDWVVGGRLLLPEGQDTVLMTATLADTAGHSTTTTRRVGISPVCSGQALTPQPRAAGPSPARRAPPVRQYPRAEPLDTMKVPNDVRDLRRRWYGTHRRARAQAARSTASISSSTEILSPTTTPPPSIGISMSTPNCLREISVLPEKPARVPP